MADGANDGSAFGIVEWPVSEPAEGLPGDETEPEVTTPEEAPLDSGEPVETPVEAEAPTEEAGEPQLYAGRFQSVDALVDGYRNVEAWGTRTAQEAAEAKREIAAMQERYDAQQQQYEQLAQIILQKQAEEDPELAQRLALMQQVQPLVDQGIQQRMAPIQQQLESQRQEEAANAEFLQLAQQVAAFRAAHPDVLPNSPQDVRLSEMVKELDLNPRAAGSLDVAWEASQNPHLHATLKAQPHLMETDEGMAEARFWAQARAQAVAAAPGNGASNGAAARTAAFVETGGTGAPVTGAPGASKDEFDEAIAVWQENRGSPLFGG
jgi:hypothetical protein